MSGIRWEMTDVVCTGEAKSIDKNMDVSYTGILQSAFAEAKLHAMRELEGIDYAKAPELRESSPPKVWRNAPRTRIAADHVRSRGRASTSPSRALAENLRTLRHPS